MDLLKKYIAETKRQKEISAVYSAGRSFIRDVLFYTVNHDQYKDDYKAYRPIEIIEKANEHQRIELPKILNDVPKTDNDMIKLIRSAGEINIDSLGDVDQYGRLIQEIGGLKRKYDDYKPWIPLVEGLFFIGALSLALLLIMRIL